MANTKSPRAGARRETLRQINTIRKTLDSLHRWWTVRSTVYVDPADRAPGSNVYLRPREVNEYPEAQPRYWAGTVAAIDKAIQDLQKLREYCVAEHDKT